MACGSLDVAFDAIDCHMGRNPFLKERYGSSVSVASGDACGDAIDCNQLRTGEYVRAVAHASRWAGGASQRNADPRGVQTHGGAAVARYVIGMAGHGLHGSANAAVNLA